MISIHALREEGDTTRLSSAESKRKFLSTPSARRATQCAMSYITTINISIHALREEGDWMISLSRAIPSISIHALREEGDM